jgi:hypothetical protein
VHFHLKTHFTPIHKMRRDLLEGESNQLARSVPNLQFNYQPSSCTQVAPSHLISQDRAHIVIRLHWKYSKQGRHGSLFVPGWQSTSERPGEDNYTNPGLKARCVALGSHSTSPPSSNQSTQVFHWVEVFNFHINSKQAWHHFP